MDIRSAIKRELSIKKINKHRSPAIGLKNSYPKLNCLSTYTYIIPATPALIIY